MTHRVRKEPGVAVLVVLTLAWLFVMELAVWRRHDRYGSFDLDLGFHTQLVWQLARGRWFSTILGLPAFGHNATFGYFLFAPLSWLGVDGPQTLDLIQTLVVASAVAPIYILARRRIGTGWPTFVLPLAWLLHPTVQAMVWETWHPEVMAAVALLWAYVAADESRWRRYWVFVLLAIIWKTDVALFVVMLGLWVALRRDRDVGTRTAVLGVVWFISASIMIPSVNDGGTAYGGLYGDLGETPSQVLQTSISHPSRLARHVAHARPVAYARDLLVPYAFVPVVAPAALALALPQIAINVLPLDDPTRDWFWAPHYQAMTLTALTLGLVEGVAWVDRRRRNLRNPICAAVLASGLAASAAWGALPFGVRWTYWWSEDGDPLRAAKDAAVAMVGPSAPVSASYLISGHLARRELVYTFPNPWRKQFYGIDSTERGDPAPIEWIVLDEGVLNDADREVQACVIATGTFEEVFRDREIVVLRRLTDVVPTDVTCS